MAHAVVCGPACVSPCPKEPCFLSAGWCSDTQTWVLGVALSGQS